MFGCFRQGNDFTGFPIQDKTRDNLSEYLEISPKQTSTKGVRIVEDVLWLFSNPYSSHSSSPYSLVSHITEGIYTLGNTIDILLCMPFYRPQYLAGSVLVWLVDYDWFLRSLWGLLLLKPCFNCLQSLSSLPHWYSADTKIYLCNAIFHSAFADVTIISIHL